MSSKLTDAALQQELGRRLAAERLARNLTQARLATQAGVSKRTVERLEAGSVGTQLSAFIRICRALDLLDAFDALIPEPAPSPTALVKMRGRLRQRASAAPAVSDRPSKPWTWGDES